MTSLLVLGGPYPLGRHLFDDALARGYTVMMFDRGRTNANLYPDVERLRGDRDGDLDALRGRDWDTVVDTCAVTHDCSTSLCFASASCSGSSPSR